MLSAPSYSEFALWDQPDKVDFLDTFVSQEIFRGYSVSRAKILLINIVAESENDYLKLQALSCLGELTLLKYFQQESIVSSLLEDIPDDAEVFVQVLRIKYLFFFYTGNPHCWDKMDFLSRHVSAEVASEALFRLGQLLFLTLGVTKQDEFMVCLQNCKRYFARSSEIIENRIDAKYYHALCELLFVLRSGDRELFQSCLSEVLENLWQLTLFSDTELHFTLETKIAVTVKHLTLLTFKVGDEPSWIDYRSDFEEVFSLHSTLMSLEMNQDSFQSAHFETFKDNLQTFLIRPLFQYNLSAAQSKINSLIYQEDGDSEFIDFLRGIQDTLRIEEFKKKDPTFCVAALARRFPDIEIAQIEQDMTQIENGNSLDLISLIVRYTEEQTSQKLTGFGAGDEILQKLKQQILLLIPEYPKSDFASFLIVLADVIRYVIRSMQEKKELFPELYDPSLGDGRTEHIFQASLFHSLRSGAFASNYFYEPNQAGGGRIDITYNDHGLMFPIEVKKTKILPTWSSVCQDYLAQAQSYTNAYNRLGVFVVFDLSPKDKIRLPINDIRELFSLQRLEGLYELGGNYPDYVVCVIVPANKVPPSSMSNYK